MKAMVVRQHGGPEVMDFVSDFPDPEIGEGDVLVRVRASSLNYHDVFTRRGMPGIKVPMPLIMGLDVAGEIAAIGPGVEGWSVGDRVLVDPINRVEGGLMGETMHGGLAELCRARAHQLVRIPDDVSFVDAAALPVAYGTAHRMLVSKGNVRSRRQGDDPGCQRRRRRVLRATCEAGGRGGRGLRQLGREAGATARHWAPIS